MTTKLLIIGFTSTLSLRQVLTAFAFNVFEAFHEEPDGDEIQFRRWSLDQIAHKIKEKRLSLIRLNLSV